MFVIGNFSQLLSTLNEGHIIVIARESSSVVPNPIGCIRGSKYCVQFKRSSGYSVMLNEDNIVYLSDGSISITHFFQYNMKESQYIKPYIEDVQEDLKYYYESMNNSHIFFVPEETILKPYRPYGRYI